MSRAINQSGTLHQLFDQAGDGVWAVDAEQRIYFWNQSAEQLLGYTAAEAIGRRCFELLAGKDLGGKPFCCYYCRILKQAQTGRPIQSFDLRVKNKDKRASWINVSSVVVPKESASANFRGVIHMFRLIGNDTHDVSPLTIRFLGPVIVQRADGSLVDGAFQTRAKVRSLFSLLVLHRHQGIQRDNLLAALWPDLPRQAGLRNLNTTIYYLRKSLEPGLAQGSDSSYIQNDGKRYKILGIQAHWMDVDAFDATIAAAHQAADPNQREFLFREAISLYRADFLADLDVNMLDCHLEQEHYRMVYLEALRGLAQILSVKQNTDEAAELYLKIISHDPYHEGAVQNLMRLVLDEHDRSHALMIYDSFKKRLRDELDLEPSKETRQIARKIRQACW